MSNKKYLALSLGPIYKTVLQARKTRELWAASYLFSHLMQLFYEQLDLELGKAEGKILSPLPPGASELFGAGVYPDRLFALAEGLSEKEVEAIIEKTITTFADTVWTPSAKHQLSTKDLKKQRASEQKDAEAFWRTYLRVVYVLVELPPQAAILAELNNRLDTLEMQPAFFSQEPQINFLLRLLDNPYQSRLRKALLTSAGKEKDTATASAYQHLRESIFNNSLFPSTSDVATLELFEHDNDAYKIQYRQATADARQIDPDDEKVQEAFYARLSGQDSSIGRMMEPYHKYFCVVFADGDNFGATIKKLGNKTSLTTTFSKAIAKFAVDAAGAINAYGGKPIYIGGDDLVFIAPVRTAKGSVFDCIEALNKVFEDIKKDDGYREAFAASTDLSFGVAMTYYKYPLFEAIDQARQQLETRAKKFKRGKNGKAKAAVAFRLLKHSGSYFEGVLGKERLPEFTGFTAQSKKGIHQNLLRSVMYKFNDLAPLVKNIYALGLPEVRIDNIRRNYFNEPVHDQHRDQIKAVTQLLKAEFADTPMVDGKGVPPMENFYATLRILDYLTPKNKNAAHESVF